MPLSPRVLLAAGAALPLSGLPFAVRAGGPSSADWKALGATPAGSVERPGTRAYDSTRRLNDPRYINYLEPSTAVLPRYYGANLARLRRVRASADPARLFASPYAL